MKILMSRFQHQISSVLYSHSLYYFFGGGGGIHHFILRKTLVIKVLYFFFICVCPRTNPVYIKEVSNDLIYYLNTGKQISSVPSFISN